MLDAIVVGAGPNGLVAACTLARSGWRVLVLEAGPRPGGAVYSVENTLPGYIHDVGAAFFPFASSSPAFNLLDLAGAGLRWCWARRDSCHPAPDGTSVAISRDLSLAVQSFGADGRAWERLALWQKRMGQRLPDALLGTLPGFGAAWRLGLRNLIGFGSRGVLSTSKLSRLLFGTEPARRVLPGLALHVDLRPDDWTGAGLGLVLGMLASWAGFPVPAGGARSITEALLFRLREAGGEVRLNSRVDRILVEGQQAIGVRTANGDEIEAKHAVLADVGAPALFLRMLEPSSTNAWLRRSMRRFRYGWGTFKMDWALSSPVPWLSEEARESAVVHAGDSIDDLIAFSRQVEAGILPDNPYLVIGQQSLLDRSRAPVGGETFWAYSHVPSQIEGSWQDSREMFADRIESRIEGLAPGFSELIRGRAIHSPVDLEAMDANLVGGDLGGGSARIDHQLFFRPAFPYFRYRTPVRGLYLCSASAHPGAGVHGACGLNAARAALADADHVTASLASSGKARG